jgi:FAD/FMN-containing dehydrogenase
MGDADELKNYVRAVERLRAQHRTLPAGSRVRLGKATSNLFRFGADATGPRLDVHEFDQVFTVDPVTRIAEVGGMTTYEHLVEATLPYGLMPLVVPQLKTITLGGAVAGLGIESTSFRAGLPHESVLEMDILLFDGQIVTARPDNEHAELFAAFPNSYGTLGYALRLRIELAPVRPYVRTRNVRFDTADETAAAIDEICRDGEYQGIGVDFIDGTVFNAGEHYLALGTFVGEAPAGTSDYTGRQIYYRSIPDKRVDNLTVHDYLWRWDPDWFWCSAAFGVQRPLVRRLWPKRYRRSDVYRKIVAFDRRHDLTGRIASRTGAPAREPVIQDVEIPVERLAEFLEFFHREVGISPIWLCPLRLRGEREWPLYPMQRGRLYVNVGFWATVELPAGRREGYVNRKIEDEVRALGGHKSLYSTAFYPQEEFWEHYNGEVYDRVKKLYDPDALAPDLYDKVINGR